MNKFLQDIIQKYEDFNTYLNNLDISDFKEFSRKELLEFVKELRCYTFKYIQLDIDKIIEEKKLQEYPELLGVHHYPEIKELECISEEDKINLDNYLVGLGFSSYIYKHSTRWYDLSKKWGKDVSDIILNFLVSKGILKTFYKLEICHDTMIFDDEKINKYLKFFEMGKRIKSLSDVEWEEYYNLEIELDCLEYYCMDCDEEITITEEMITSLVNNSSSYVYKVIKQRDTNYDNK